MLGPLAAAFGLVWLYRRRPFPAHPTGRRGRVTAGWGDGRGHKGVDYAVPRGTPIRAVLPGRVEWAGWDDAGGGYVVRVRHGDGSSTHYAHLSGFSPAAESRSRVAAGDVVGYSGNTGRVRGVNGGYHLHFGWRDARGRWLNPERRLYP